MKATIVGLGLIGGSFALGLRKSGLATALIGVDRNVANAEKAVELGLVDSILPEDEALARRHDARQRRRPCHCA